MCSLFSSITPLIKKENASSLIETFFAKPPTPNDSFTTSYQQYQPTYISRFELNVKVFIFFDFKYHLKRLCIVQFHHLLLEGGDVLNEGQHQFYLVSVF